MTTTTIINTNKSDHTDDHNDNCTQTIATTMIKANVYKRITGTFLTDLKERTGRLRGKQTDRQTERQIDRQAGRQADRQTEAERERHTRTQRQTQTETDRQTDANQQSCYRESKKEKRKKGKKGKRKKEQNDEKLCRSTGLCSRHLTLNVIPQKIILFLFSLFCHKEAHSIEYTSMETEPQTWTQLGRTLRFTKVMFEARRYQKHHKHSFPCRKRTGNSRSIYTEQGMEL